MSTYPSTAADTRAELACLRTALSTFGRLSPTERARLDVARALAVHHGLRIADEIGPIADGADLVSVPRPRLPRPARRPAHRDDDA